MNEKNSKRLSMLGLLAGLTALLAACGSRPTPGAMPKPNAAPKIPEITIEFNGTEFKVPSTMPGGIVAVTVTNTSDKPKSIGFSRLRPNKTAAQVYAQMKAAPEDLGAVFGLLSSVGTLDPVLPGKPERLVMDLKSGTFLLDATDHFEEAPPPDAPRVYGEFATNSVVGTLEPQASVTAELHDFALILPDELKAGKQTWQVRNSGKQWHMFLIAKPNAGVSADDVLKAMATDGPPAGGQPPFEIVGGIAPISEGERLWVDIDLAPGTYVLICPVPDLMASSGGPPKSHAEHGMHRTLVVK